MTAMPSYGRCVGWLLFRCLVKQCGPCGQEETKIVGGKTVGTGTWKPSLTLLRIDRAALDVKWSPDGKKFALASGAKSVPVCHYEADQVPK
jgi:hypothetical protein